MILLFLFLSIAYSSEFMKEGDVLKYDARVQTIEEAQKNRLYILELEQDNDIKENIIVSKDEVIKNKDMQIRTLEEHLKNKDDTVQKYIEINKLDQDRIKYQDKALKRRRLENTILFSAGVATALSLIIIADKLDDEVLEN